jgi:hypothetical protein
MRTRANFGIIGPAQTLTVSSTGLVASSEDQRIAKGGGKWPLPTIQVKLLIVGGGGGGGVNWGGGGGAGGSGVVIIQYADTLPAAASTTGSPNILVSGGFRTYSFINTSGSITF